MTHIILFLVLLLTLHVYEVPVPGHAHAPQRLNYPSGLIKAFSKQRQLDP